jgi:hypothetical protein
MKRPRGRRLSPEHFAGKTIAHLRYAALLGGKPGVAILRQHLRDTTWATAPDVWLNTAFQLSNTLSLPRAYAEIARQAGNHRAHRPGLLAAIGPLVLGCTDAGDRASVTKAFAALLRYAEPGDAGVLLDAVSLVKESGIPGTVVDWLIANGTGELRSKDRVTRVALLAIHLAHGDDADRDRATRLLELVVDGEYPGGAWAHGYSHVVELRDTSLWAAIEVALDRGLHEDNALRLLDVPDQFLTAYGDALEAPLTGSAYPTSRALMLRALASGRLHRNVARVAWPAAIRVLPPERLTMQLDALEAGFDTLVTAMVDPPAKRRALVAWARTLSDAFFEQFGPCSIATPALPLQCSPAHIAGWPWFHTPVRAALEHHLTAPADRSAHQNLELARTILAKHPEPAAVVPALAALPAWRSVTAPSPASDFRRTVAARLTRSLARPWPVFAGLDLGEIRRGARHVEIAKLSDDDQVRVTGGTIRLDAEYIDKLASEPDRDRALTLATLFFFHELIHLAQGIGKKSTVTALRSAGSETTLKHLDLHADHLAACFTAATHPAGSGGPDLVTLKDLQSSALAAFPTGRFHTTASRARKATRFVSLRADVHARRLGLVDPDRGGYVYVEYAPFGGAFAVLEAGPVTKVLSTATRISSQAAQQLGTAADPGVDAEPLVDKILLQLLRRPPT